ncbi:response regulator [Adhaeribacter aerolatus]|nr:response regulator [Adhaeribacter aerolatus]
MNTVLLVDDDDNWCFLSKKILKKAGIGEEILTAHNGREALKKLQDLTANGEKLPDLIFLDIKMPVMDGFEFLEALTKTPELNLDQTRIYMCTSSFHPKDRERAELYPIAGFLTKPLTPEVLKEL